MLSFSINSAKEQAAFGFSGFSELRSLFRESNTVILSSCEIRDALRRNYKFTDGQASGTIKRACDKKLLFSLGNSQYVYNNAYPDGVATYISDSDRSGDTQSVSDMAVLSSTALAVGRALKDMVSVIATSVDISRAPVDAVSRLKRQCNLMVLVITQIGIRSDHTGISDIGKICDDIRVISPVFMIDHVSIASIISDGLDRASRCVDITNVSLTDQELESIHAVLSWFRCIADELSCSEPVCQ